MHEKDSTGQWVSRQLPWMIRVSEGAACSAQYASPITPRAGVFEYRRECQPFADARVQCRKWLAGKSQKTSDSFRFSGREWVMVAADFRIEARHAGTPVFLLDRQRPKRRRQRGRVRKGFTAALVGSLTSSAEGPLFPTEGTSQKRGLDRSALRAPGRRTPPASSIQRPTCQRHREAICR